jgi:hypothetical protein
MTANRIVFDATGAIATFDLGAANTLTLCGQDQTSGAWAFGVPPAGSNATLRLVSGTISIPYAPKSGWKYTNCVMKLTRESSAHDFRFVVSGSDGTCEVVVGFDVDDPALAGAVTFLNGEASAETPRRINGKTLGGKDRPCAAAYAYRFPVGVCVAGANAVSIEAMETKASLTWCEMRIK